MKRLREFIEKVLYAGMKPGAVADPLYLSNRSPMRKFLSWCAIGVPFAGTVVLLYFAASGQFSRRPRAIPESRQVAVGSAVLPNYKDVQPKTTQDIVVTEARLEHQTATLSGSVKNVSSRRIPSAEIIFDLMDRAGSQLAGVSANIENIEPQGTAGFQVKVPHREAIFTIVREIHVR